MTYLRFIGIILFLFIVVQIEFSNVLRELRQLHPLVFLAAFLLQFGNYTCKTLRWHILVSQTGIRTSLHQSWMLYNIGIFLSIITPAKIGEFGKVAYLRSAGVSAAKGIVLVLIDRIADIIVITLLFLVSIMILFGYVWHILLASILLGMVCLLFRKVLTVTIQYVRHHKNASALTLLFTIGGWGFYFAWAVLTARSIGIDVSALTLTAVFTMTGMLTLLPIAPAGLGTRDAALITLLAPYGTEPTQAVALALLMFASQAFSGIPGLIYWLTSPIKTPANSTQKG